MKKIAITGGIGSGKSAVCKIIKDKGFPVFSCDEIYKTVVQSAEYIQKIEKAFPFVVVNGAIDKQKLASIVFSNEKELEKLNSIAHPIIMDTLLAQMETANSSLVFAEVPLLFEGNYQSLFDMCLIVQRKKADRIEAVRMRDGLDRKNILSRMRNQVNHCKIKRSKTVYKISNNDSLEKLKEEIDIFIESLY